MSTFITALSTTITTGSVLILISYVIHIYYYSSNTYDDEKEEEEEEISELFGKNEEDNVGNAHDVYVSTRIFRIDSINDSENTFGASLLLFVVWRDDKTTASLPIGHRLTEDEFENEDEAFNPNITIVNMKEGHEDFWNPNPRPKVVPASLFPKIFPSSQVKKLLLLVKPITGVFRQDFELMAFPFDIQEYALIFRPVDANHRVRIQSLEGTSFRSSVSPSIPSDALGVSFGYPKIVSKIDRVSMNRPYSTLSFVFMGKRKAGFFVYTFYSVLFIVQTCSAMIFAAPYQVETRFESILSLLLTVTAMKFVANESLPRISYRTMLDDFMFVSLIMVWSCALWSCTLTTMAFKTDEEKIEMDRAAAGVYVGVYILYSITYMIRVARLRIQNDERIEDRARRWIGTGHEDSWNQLKDRWFDRQVTLKMYNKKYKLWSDEELEKRLSRMKTRREQYNEEKMKKRMRRRKRRSKSPHHRRSRGHSFYRVCC